VVGHADRVATVWSASFFDPQIFDRAVDIVYPAHSPQQPLENTIGAVALFWHSLFTDPDLKGAPIDWLDGGKVFVEICAFVTLVTIILRARHARKKSRPAGTVRRRVNLGT
jgi:hypothetical protein